MTARITQLIEGLDNFELIRDQIAAILVVESEAQQAMALAEDKDPALWKLRVFAERANPWEEFQSDDGRDVPDDRSPIVNVSFDNTTFDKGSSNVVERQHGTGTFFVDCYGYGVSADSSDGHKPGDQVAAFEAQRAVRLARRILMAGAYTYLGFPQQKFIPPESEAEQVVWGRWPQGIQVFQPQIGDRPIAHVIAARFTLQVDFNELSSQVEGLPLAELSIVFRHPTTEQVLLRAFYEYPMDEES